MGVQRRVGYDQALARRGHRQQDRDPRERVQGQAPRANPRGEPTQGYWRDVRVLWRVQHERCGSLEGSEGSGADGADGANGRTRTRRVVEEEDLSYRT